MAFLLGFVTLITAGLLVYWLLVVGELSYFGSRAVQLIYHLGAPHYDAVRHAVTAHDAQVLAPLLLQTVERYRAARVLDVATGTGRVPLLLAAAPSFQGQLIGLDLTPAMLAQARTRQQHYGLHNIEWEVGPAEYLRWPAESFDIVVCLEALEFFSQPRRALSEMARVLRPNGTLLVSKYPDGWARMLPGRAMTRRSMQAHLEAFGLCDIDVRSWQPGHYELVIARKPVQLCPDTYEDAAAPGF